MLAAIHERKRREPLALWMTAVLVGLGLFLVRNWWLSPAEVPDGRLLGYTSKDVDEFLRAIGPGGRHLYAWSEVTLDVAFSLVYGVAFARLVARATTAPLGRFAIVLPALAAGIDIVENVLLAGMTWGVFRVTLAEVASPLTRAKWVVIGLVFVSLLPGAVLALRRLARRCVSA